jgi:Putative Flp pilus-assembly TadE/G-like
VLVTFAVFLPLAMAIAAIVFDAGFAWGLKRHLQASADAAALAGAQDLPNGAAAITTATEYSASSGGKNHRSALPNVATHVEVLAANTKVKVTQTAESPTWFARLLGLNKVDVSAYAIASRSSTTSGSPLAIFVYERCGTHGVDKGLIAGGDNMIVEGAIHSNGNWEVKNPGFVSWGNATWYRPPPQGASALNPSNPQGTPCKNIDQSDSRYCTTCAGGAIATPADGPWRTWVTAGQYDTRAQVITKVGPCTHSPSGDVALENVTFSAPRVYCLAPGKKFELKGNVQGAGGTLAPLTVIADIITVGGTSKLRPAKDTEPVLFYSTSTIEIILNPSVDSDWAGYIINRFGGLKVNAANVTSPHKGLLEAQWVEINGENFRMIGTAPDTIGGTVLGGVVLEE